MIFTATRHQLSEETLCFHNNNPNLEELQGTTVFKIQVLLHQGKNY